MRVQCRRQGPTGQVRAVKVWTWLVGHRKQVGFLAIVILGLASADAPSHPNPMGLV
jgi:hypothetical protein